MNYLWLDVETTGLNEKKQDIIQLACIPVINGIPQKSFNEFCQPINWNSIDPYALKVTGTTMPMLRSYQSPEVMIEKFVEYVQSFGVKFTIAGYNVGFDKKFISATFKKLNRTSDFFKMFDITVHCTFNRAKSVKTQIASKNLKLGTLAELYDIEINAHDALSDIEATIKVDEIVSELLNEDNTIYVPDIVANDVEINVGFPEMAQLHVHSQYNMSTGVPLPEDWYKWAAENDVPGIAVVDQGVGISLFNSVRNKENTVAVSGLGINVIPDDELVLEMLLDKEPEPFSLNCWATTTQGYNNLVKLSSLGYEHATDVNGILTPRLTI